MGVKWVQVGYTEYNDPPPGAGNLAWGGYSIAELGTATRQGQATGVGNLAFFFNYPGEVPMGTLFTIYHNGRLVYARKEDRGYGQGGDGTHSDRAYAIDLYDGSQHGLPNLPGAIRAAGKGAIWIMWGQWRKGDPLPRGAAKLQAAEGTVYPQAITPSRDPPDHSPKVQYSGKLLGVHGSHISGNIAQLKTLRDRYLTPRLDERSKHVNA